MRHQHRPQKIVNVAFADSSRYTNLFRNAILSRLTSRSRCLGVGLDRQRVAHHLGENAGPVHRRLPIGLVSARWRPIEDLVRKMGELYAQELEKHLKVLDQGKSRASTIPISFKRLCLQSRGVVGGRTVLPRLDFESSKPAEVAILGYRCARACVG